MKVFRLVKQNQYDDAHAQYQRDSDREDTGHPQCPATKPIRFRGPLKEVGGGEARKRKSHYHRDEIGQRFGTIEMMLKVCFVILLCGGCDFSNEPRLMEVDEPFPGVF